MNEPGGRVRRPDGELWLSFDADGGSPEALRTSLSAVEWDGTGLWVVGDEETGLDHQIAPEKSKLEDSLRKRHLGR